MCFLFHGSEMFSGELPKSVICHFDKLLQEILESKVTFSNFLGSPVITPETSFQMVMASAFKQGQNRLQSNLNLLFPKLRYYSFSEPDETFGNIRLILV